MAMTASAPGFDTLSYARRLKEAGVDEAQAEAHAEAVRAAITEGAATKADIVRLEAKVENGLARLETRLTIRFYGMAAGIVAAVVALIKLLP